MNKFIRFLSVMLVLTMLVPMFVMTSFAEEGVDPSVEVNWKTFAVKYSAATMKPILPGGSPRRTGFTFTEGPNGEIQVKTPDYDTNPGIVATSVVSSKHKTPLSNLEVTINPDNFDFTLDGGLASNNFSVLWSENPIDAIVEKVGDVTTGLADAVGALSNGLRYLAPAESKSLCIFVNNNYPEYSGTKTASTVYIMYFNGTFYDGADSHPGYRWSFIARNHVQTPNGDQSGISRPYEQIDITNGLTVKVKPDDRLGYIVNINGKDYYKGSDVGYFPSDTGILEETDYTTPTEKYTSSMTYKRQDIDLSGLKSVSEGYLSIGSSSNTNKELTRADYSIVTINGRPAVNWKGEPNFTYTDWEVVVDATCTEDGLRRRTVVETGEVQEEAIPATGHTVETWTVDAEADYVNEGSRTGTCTVCGETFTEVIPKLDLPFTDVSDSQWFASYVRKVFQEGLMKGMSDTVFAPDGNVTRAQFATTLANLDPAFNKDDYKTTPFKDCPDNAWYVSYVAWAYEKGIVTGTGDGIFSPDANVTREQMALMMFKFAQYMELDTEGRADISQYTDANKIGSWAVEAVKWAVDAEVIGGTSSTTLSPNSNATRAQVATILTKFLLLFDPV